MSLAFNGSTSSLVHTTADLGMASSVSVLCWIKMAGYGEGGVGIILGRDEGNNAFRIFSSSATSGVKLRNITGDTPGEWNYALALDTWYCVAVTFDRTNSPTPNPIFYVREVGVDSELISVSVTENQTPVGSSETPATGYCNGSNAAGSQTFNGLQARLQAWDAIVSEANLEAASTGPGSYTTNLKLYIDDSMDDQSGNGFDPTVTDVTTDAEDPIDFGGGGGAMSGISAGTSTATGALTASGALAGASAGAGSTAGLAVGAGALGGASAGVGEGSGAIAGAGALGGQSDGAGGASGAAGGAGALGGQSDGAGAASAGLGGVGAVVGEAAGAGTAAGDLDGTAGAAGQSGGSGSGTGAMTGAGALSGSSSGSSTAALNLDTDQPIDTIEAVSAFLDTLEAESLFADAIISPSRFTPDGIATESEFHDEANLVSFFDSNN